MSESSSPSSSPVRFPARLIYANGVDYPEPTEEEQLHGEDVMPRCYIISKMSHDEIENFIKTGQKPARCDTVNLATICALQFHLGGFSQHVWRIPIHDGLNQRMPGLVHAIDDTVKLPDRIANLSNKIWNKIHACEWEDLNDILATPVKDFYKVRKRRTPEVGQECHKVGIMLSVLENGWDNPAGVVVTKLMVAEIEACRERKGKDVSEAKQWLEKLLGQEVMKEVDSSSLEWSLKVLKEIAEEAKKQGSEETLRQLRQDPYIPPVRQGYDRPTCTGHYKPATLLEAVTRDKIYLREQLKKKDAKLEGFDRKQWEHEREVQIWKRWNEDDNKEMRKKQKLLEESEANAKSKENQLKMEIDKLREEKAALATKCEQLQADARKWSKYVEIYRAKNLKLAKTAAALWPLYQKHVNESNVSKDDTSPGTM